ncbi:hypothetical protein [Legionella longbeachae]|uniref:hypothetical protein n=1 Tax=Legionella longbeachae TaxID=450 RepID=UPI001248C708|nr:hypothetical protein [Legionella longbeachae]QEY52094.1 hypothetical protein FQU71_13135 [Legionella longbeachae]
MFDFKKDSQANKNMLIVILAKDLDEDKRPLLGLPSLHVQFAIEHALKHHTSVVVLSRNGKIYDLSHSKIDNFTIDNATKETRDLKNQIIQLKTKSQLIPLEKQNNKFDQELVIGNMIYLTEEAGDSLRKLNEQKMMENGLIRVQICNFFNRTIVSSTDDFEFDIIPTNDKFVEKIIPNFCELSIPGNWSIISKKGTIAIDIHAMKKDFDKIKGPLNQFLSESSNLMEEIQNKLKLLLKKYSIPESSVKATVINIDKPNQKELKNPSGY